MPSVGIIRAFMQQASAQGARSTALNPLLWSLGSLLSALMVSVHLRGDLWLVATTAAMVGANLLVLLFSYLYLLTRDRDALRSERFTLSKMAIEKSLTGDTLSGFRMLELDDEAASAPTSQGGTLGGQSE